MTDLTTLQAIGLVILGYLAISALVTIIGLFLDWRDELHERSSRDDRHEYEGDGR